MSVARAWELEKKYAAEAVLSSAWDVHGQTLTFSSIGYGVVDTRRRKGYFQSVGHLTYEDFQQTTGPNILVRSYLKPQAL